MLSSVVSVGEGGSVPLKGSPNATVPADSLSVAGADQPSLSSVEAAQVVHAVKQDAKQHEATVAQVSQEKIAEKRKEISESGKAPLPTDDAIRAVNKAARQGSTRDEPLVDASGVALGGKSGLEGGVAAGGAGVSGTQATSEAACGGAGNVATAEIIPSAPMTE
jgi:hypothetical protein